MAMALDGIAEASLRELASREAVDATSALVPRRDAETGSVLNPASAAFGLWCSTTYALSAEDRWMLSLATAEGSGPGSQYPAGHPAQVN
jgi:hypothetical protein